MRPITEPTPTETVPTETFWDKLASFARWMDEEDTEEEEYWSD